MRTIRIALAATVAAAMIATVAQADTSEFLTKAMQGDNSETKLGALAAKQGQSAGARRFGAMLAQDHRKGKAQAAGVAARHKVPVTDALADEAMTEYGVLQRLHGAAFDHEFGRYMIEDHTKDIADFEKELATKDPADVRALARQTLPVLRKHLAVAKSIG